MGKSAQASSLKPSSDPARETLLELAAVTVKIRKLRKEPEVLKLLALEAQAEGLEKTLKTAVRERAVQGETVVVWDDEIATVQVISASAGPIYDPGIAVGLWPPEVFSKSIAVDSKKVAAFVETGALLPEQAARAERPREPLTPRVKIEIHGKGAK